MSGDESQPHTLSQPARAAYYIRLVGDVDRPATWQAMDPRSRKTRDSLAFAATVLHTGLVYMHILALNRKHYGRRT